MLSAHVLAATLKITVNAEYCSSVGELIRKFLLCQLCGKYRIINNICWFLHVTRFFHVTDCCLTEALSGLGHLFSVTCWCGGLTNNELTAWQNLKTTVIPKILIVSTVFLLNIYNYVDIYLICWGIMIHIDKVIQKFLCTC